MKLFTRYNRINLFATVLIFLLASIAYYFSLRFVMINQLDENLKIEKEEIETFAAKYHQLPEIIPVSDQLISFVPSSINYSKTSFHIIRAYDRNENDSIAFREMYFTFKAGGKWYQATVGKSMEGTESLIKSILVITVGTILLILSASLVINRIVLKKLWQPFYHSLHLLKDYKVGAKVPFAFSHNNIEEFSFMNNVLLQATKKADSDYLLLKEFTENASHEIQTPLAIIRSKLDLLIQDETISHEHELTVQALYDAVQKLTRLNASLLLLTKIENNQFRELSEINLQQKLHKKLLQLSEMIANNNLEVILNLEEVTISMNTELIDIMLNNLLSNALKHNIENGRIEISTYSEKQLIIKNTGAPEPLDNQRIYTRFYKSHHNTNQTGLGLSILQQICIVSNCTISYSFHGNLHSFTIQWQ